MQSIYLWSTSDYSYFHPHTSGLPQTILTAIQITFGRPRTIHYSIQLPLIYPQYPHCHTTTSYRPQTILTTVHLPLVNLRQSLLPSNYLWSTQDCPHCYPPAYLRPSLLPPSHLCYNPDYTHCHKTTSGRQQIILTAIQLPLVHIRLFSLPSNNLW